MFKEGTRVVIVDEVEAWRIHALVHKGDKGTIGTPRDGDTVTVNVHMDGDPSPWPWAIPASCVRRIRKTSRPNEGGKNVSQ